MNYFDLMKAITYAHVEAQGLKVSASIPSAPGAELVAGGEGTVAASPAVPSFEYLLAAEIVDKVERKKA